MAGKVLKMNDMNKIKDSAIMNKSAENLAATHTHNRCSYRRFLGIPCPGCGMQTAFIDLLKGKLWQSITDYPSLIPLILTVLTLILHLIFKFRHGAAVIKYLFIFTVILIVGNYISKFI